MALELKSRLLGRNMLALVVLLGCVVGGARQSMAESRRSYGHRVIASLLEEPLEIDPLEVQTQTELTMVSLFFDTLFVVRDGELVPHLALSLPDRSDALLVHIPIRQGVLFHDSHQLQPKDVAMSLERVRASRYGYLLDSVKSIEAGPNEIVLRMRRDDPDLATRLSDVHTSVTAGGRAQSWRRLQGSGAFRLKQRSAAGREVQLLANEHYFAGRSFVDELVLRWFEDAGSEARGYETGDSQMSLRGDIAFAGHRPKFKTRSTQEDAGILVYLGFGSQQAITSDAAFRHAASAAIGRNGMEQIGSGENVEATLSVLPGNQRARVKADTKTAGRLMASLANRYASLESGSLELELIVNKSRPDDVAIADRVAAALFQFGIRTRRVELDAKGFLRRARSGQCDLYIGQLSLEAPSDEDRIRAAFVAGRGEAALASLSGLALPKLMKSFDSHLPIVPLFHRGIRLHYRSDIYGVGFSRSMRLLFEDMFVSGLPEKN